MPTLKLPPSMLALKKEMKKAKTKREDVYKIIDGERAYQDTVRKEYEHDERDQLNISLAEWLLYIETQLNKAKAAVYALSDEATTMCIVRKITALGVACMENNGTPERFLPPLMNKKDIKNQEVEE